MNLGRTVFAQLISFLPDREFRRCVSRYDGDHRWRSFSGWDQFLSMGFRPADLPRKPPRYRSVPAFAFRQALPHGIPLPGGALDTGRRQRIARLEDLCRFRPSLDSHRAALVRPRSDRRRSRSNPLRSGLDHHRPVPLAVPVGQVPPAQGCCEDAHAAGPARQHPHVYPHYRRQNARRQHPRRDRPRARRLLRHGSGLRRFRTPLRVHPLLVVLRRANQEEHLAPTALLASRRQVHGRALGSDRHPGRHRIGPSVSGPVAGGSATSTPRRTSGCSS